MAKEVITTSLVISFGETTTSAATNLFKVEVDDRETGPNKGKTSGWLPGDSVYLLLYVPEAATLLNWTSSAGSLGSVGSASKAVEEYLQFENDPEKNTSYPMPATFSGKWLGNNLGNVVRFDEGTIKLTASSLPDPYAGVYEINYTAPAQSWVLSNTFITHDRDYPIIVFFQAEIETGSSGGATIL